MLRHAHLLTGPPTLWTLGSTGGGAPPPEPPVVILGRSGTELRRWSNQQSFEHELRRALPSQRITVFERPASLRSMLAVFASASAIVAASPPAGVAEPG